MVSYPHNQYDPEELEEDEEDLEERLLMDRMEQEYQIDLIAAGYDIIKEPGSEDMYWRSPEERAEDIKAELEQKSLQHAFEHRLDYVSREYLQQLETDLRQYQQQRLEDEAKARAEHQAKQDAKWAEAGTLAQSLGERWREMLADTNLPHKGTAAVDLVNGNMMYLTNKLDPEEEPVVYLDLAPNLLAEAARAAGPTGETVIYVPVNRIEHDYGKVSYLGIPRDETVDNNFPNLRNSVEDLSLDATLSWKAAEMALGAFTAAQEQGPPDPMAGYNIRMKDFRQAVQDIIDQVEATTAPEALHEDQSYIIALRAQSILTGLQSNFEYSTYTRNDTTTDNISSLRVMCATRAMHMASLEGDQVAIDEAQARLDAAVAIKERTKKELRNSSFITAFTQASSVPSDNTYAT